MLHRVIALAALLYLTLLLPLAHAQATGEEPSPLSEIEIIDRTLKSIGRVIGLPQADDASLVGARARLESIRNELNSLEADAADRLATINTQIEQLGPQPEAGAPEEAPAIAEQRANLARSRSNDALVATRSRELKELINQNVDRISKRRRDAFTSALYTRTPISFDLFQTARAEVSAAANDTTTLLRRWITYLTALKSTEALISAFLALVAALGFSRIFGRWFARLFYRDQSLEDPPFFAKISTGLWGTLIPSAVLAVFLGGTYALFEYFQVLTPGISLMVGSFFLAIAGIFFISKLANTIFYPKNAAWRLLELKDGAASKFYWLTLALAMIYAVDFLVAQITQITSAGLGVTVFRSFFTSIATGFVLFVAAWSGLDSRDTTQVVFTGEEISSPRKLRGFPRWLSILMALIGFVMVGAALAGYLGLSRFLVQQVVFTGATLTMMYIGLIAGRQMGAEGVLVQSRAGKAMQSALGLPEDTVEQLSIILGIIFMGLVLVIGIPLILLQWGSAPGDISLWFGRLMSGFEIGAIRFSLTGIFIGIATFVIGLILTRMFQRWLSASVLPRMKADSGVRDSIRAGVGYAGIALAVLFAVTNAGLDLSSLAIVAGALSLGIGFGLQNIVSNFVSGLILLVERPIKIGDWIEVDTAAGFVRKISVRATEIETFQRQSIIVPNSELINGRVGNWTHKSKSGRVDIPIGVAYGSDMEKVEELLLKAVESCSAPLNAPEPFVFFAGFGDNSINFELRVHLRDILLGAVAKKEMAYAIVKLFAENDIEIPFPQRDLHIRSDQTKVFEGPPMTSRSSRKPKSKPASK